MARWDMTTGQRIEPMSDQHIFTYTSPDPAPGFFGVKSVDGQAVITLRGSGYAQDPDSERTMVIPPDNLLVLAHALIRYVTRVGIMSTHAMTGTAYEHDEAFRAAARGRT